jgi:glycyl-tRNA synthetase
MPDAFLLDVFNRASERRSNPMAEATVMEKIVSLCKRRGFVYPASEIYGGLNGFWDYGPLGAQLKKNLRDAWWQDMIMNPAGGAPGPNGEAVRIVPLDTTIIQHPKVWEASGHVAGFNDPQVDCRETKARYRADHVLVYGPKSGERGSRTCPTRPAKPSS